MAVALKDVEGFSRPGIDGKRAQNRFLLLVRQHKASNLESARASGVSEDETEKSKLLDDLVPLYNDTLVKKKLSAQPTEAEEKAANIKFIREQAMLRGRRKSSESGDASDGSVLSKRKLIQDAQDKEMDLERERIAFKKLKFEREMEEKRIAWSVNSTARSASILGNGEPQKR
ncbi:hypothetical protein H310_11875 [Aphanomyces invadans]|nr:hypothetical protein H310_11875 [Aphanomyces invadans]ETV94614.1 hypothetical protein H310_11875 [Aphanomyces invadans]|eukprot:XP_008876929.1 hypothetical protein H310_11875 [Aphanomyces invadans]